MTQYANYFFTALAYLGIYFAGVWTREIRAWVEVRRQPKVSWKNEPIGRVTKTWFDDKGMYIDAEMDMNSEEGRKAWAKISDADYSKFSMVLPNSPEATFVPPVPGRFKRWWINTPRRNGRSERAAKHARELREVLYTDHDKDLRDLVPDFKTTKPLTFANKVTVRREDLEGTQPSLIDTLQPCTAYIVLDKPIFCQKTVGDHQPDPNRGGLFTDHGRGVHRARIEHPEYGEFGGYQIIAWEGLDFDTEEVAYTEEQK